MNIEFLFWDLLGACYNPCCFKLMASGNRNMEDSKPQWPHPVWRRSATCAVCIFLYLCTLSVLTMYLHIMHRLCISITVYSNQLLLSHHSEATLHFLPTPPSHKCGASKSFGGPHLVWMQYKGSSIQTPHTKRSQYLREKVQCPALFGEVFNGYRFPKVCNRDASMESAFWSKSYNH